MTRTIEHGKRTGYAAVIIAIVSRRSRSGSRASAPASASGSRHPAKARHALADRRGASRTCWASPS